MDWRFRLIAHKWQMPPFSFIKAVCHSLSHHCCCDFWPCTSSFCIFQGILKSVPASQHRKSTVLALGFPLKWNSFAVQDFPDPKLFLCVNKCHVDQCCFMHKCCIEPSCRVWTDLHLTLNTLIMLSFKALSPCNWFYPLGTGSSWSWMPSALFDFDE